MDFARDRRCRIQGHRTLVLTRATSWRRRWLRDFLRLLFPFLRLIGHRMVRALGVLRVFGVLTAFWVFRMLWMLGVLWMLAFAHGKAPIVKGCA
jgi:hypothetical protein